ncbi:uncharacterized protein LOC120075245 isoform X2 [Benincasa hispida]|uniref:uncharacterized protein LOC120075245 isoform X2 n=1 Tax=Benincasa hispida TaxID=102211 RepID=UPI0019005B69|nr:uncharacterized protein LOC120075245 isoform X2 [Benincasa hispida]
MATPSLSFPTEFPYDFDSFFSNSDLNSPVESVGSSVTDSTDSSGSDDDDFFVGLAQQLAWTSLCETEKSTSPSFNPKNFEMYVKAGSPQSTLTGIDTWFRPESPSSQLQSPPMAVFGAENDARALLHAAAREAARLKMSGETTPFRNNDPFMREYVGARSSIPVKSTNNVDYGVFSNQNCARNLAFAAQMQQVKQDLVLQALRASSWGGRQAKVSWSAQPHWKAEIQSRERNVLNASGRCGGNTGGLYHSPWLPPPQNQQPPSNPSVMRCIHPGRSGVKRASSGTGVFLPRRYISPSECRQKQGSPAVRFAEEMKSPIQAPLNGWLSPSIDSMLSRRNNPLLPLPRSFRTEGAMNQELHLPQEWTY